MGAVLEIRDLRKRYGRAEALAGVSFSVAAGEMFGLLGPNGAGKTTLLSVVAGLLEPDGGGVALFGNPVVPGDKSWRPLVGMATQEIALYRELTGRENLRFFGRLYGLCGGELAARVDEVLELAGLKDKADGRVRTYSGGMMRRLNLGAAVMHRPKLLLLDEPTAGVDPQSRHHLFERIRTLNAAGLTVVYTSHYMEEVQAICPRAAILDRGRLVACDRVADLVRDGGSLERTFLRLTGSALRD